LIEDLLSEFMGGSGGSSNGGGPITTADYNSGGPSGGISTAGATPSSGSASSSMANYTPSSSTSVGSGQPAGNTANAASLAEQYRGWGEPQLQADGVDESAPYGESCADFVSSMLQKSGLINWHTNLVSDLATQLPAQGWRQVSLADAKPGDVWICNGANGESHTEIVASNNNGRVTLIGSNNVSSDMQQVSYDSYSASIPGSYILAPP
jgi:CHAP domain